ncbi:BgTH12-01492 [Blumeria graminis f. sp. triticale]|uniref:NADPH:adrenodoxin oxidoreductase, mitochondrial n=5 Tax=Blumeria graminis TaxID=34373 RepID=A0A9X9QBJ4_BLUGR|nr:BgTH12-01492 [Blumeria graminis f. sp. triticale]VDB83655.1 Bgt-5493 [Blumeria graminis f. sp. tritici]
MLFLHMAHHTSPIRRACFFLRKINCSIQRHAYVTDSRQARQRAPFHMAVVGAGPAGFYTAHRVLSKIQDARVDMFERWPTPFGLTRYGVAPDHAEVRKCQEKFKDIAGSPNFTYIGNVAIGQGANSVPLKSLLPHYDAIVFTYGASRDRKLGIPGEDQLDGVYSARSFVGWYNGLPEIMAPVPDLTATKEAIIIGQGNVALDIARIILTDPESLKNTDIPQNVLAALRESKIERIRIIGRRGLVQAAFTIKEIRELGSLSNVVIECVPDFLMPDENTINKLPRARRRLINYIRDNFVESRAASPSINLPTVPSDSRSGSVACQYSSVDKRLLTFDFNLSPKSFNSRSTCPNKLGTVTFERTALSPNPFNVEAKAIGTGETVEIRASLVFTSIGYAAEALLGFEEVGIPFDEHRGVIPSDHFGRVKPKNGLNIPGMYCSGWVKTGSTGVIANTMQDAFSTADAIIHDWENGDTPFLRSENSEECLLGWRGVCKDFKVRQLCRPITWDDWQIIDSDERTNGLKSGKDREKFTSVEDMLAALKK